VKETFVDLPDGAEKQGKRLDYKWVVIGVCFLTVMITLGFCSSTKSLYLDVVTKKLGIDRSLFALNDTFRFIANAIVNLFFGTLVFKFGTKRLMVAGTLCLTGSMLCYALANNLFMFYLGGVLLGIGFSWTGTTMIGCVINKWCKENRGTIMGAVLAANGLGGAVAIQLLSPIIEAGGESYRNAYFISGLAVLLIGILILIFMKESPKYYTESRAVHKKKTGRSEPWPGISFAKAKATPYFYVALICIFLTGFCLQGITCIAKAHRRDVGLTAEYEIENISGSNMPLTFSLHTTFVEPEDFCVPIDMCQEKDFHHIPTGRYIDLTDEEREYAAGSPSRGKVISGYYRACGNIARVGDYIYEVSEKFDHWILFNGRGESGLLCVEPQSGKVNGLNMNDGHTVLAPCEKIIFTTKISRI